MVLLRCFILLSALLFLGLSNSSLAAQRSHGLVTKEDQSLRGTWYSAKESITFKDNGTINFKGRRYYYAVSNGGLIQLTGKHSSNAIPYQLSGGKLTLTVNGKSTVYTRKRRRK